MFYCQNLLRNFLNPSSLAPHCSQLALSWALLDLLAHFVDLYCLHVFVELNMVGIPQSDGARSWSSNNNGSLFYHDCLLVWCRVITFSSCMVHLVVHDRTKSPTEEELMPASINPKHYLSFLTAFFSKAMKHLCLFLGLSWQPMIARAWHLSVS